MVHSQKHGKSTMPQQKKITIHFKYIYTDPGTIYQLMQTILPRQKW